MPYPDADRLVLIEEARGDADPGTTGYFSFAALRNENASFDRISALGGWFAILAGVGRDAERVVGARVTWDYVRTLGVQPSLGRDFEPGEDHPERRRVAIISDELWRRRYSADPTVVGRPLTINQVTYTRDARGGHRSGDRTQVSGRTDLDAARLCRGALGVSPARLLRQLLTEAVVLAALGGAAGALLAWWGTAVLAANGPDTIPRLNEATVNARVLLYALAISVVTGVSFGMAPARLLVVRRDLSGVGARRTTAGPGAWRYRVALISINVALSVLLLIGSGLLVRSFLSLMTVDAGFNAQSLLTFEVALTKEAFAENAGINQFYDQVSERLRARPGVVSVNASTQLPLTGSIDRSGWRRTQKTENCESSAVSCKTIAEG